MFIFCFHEGPCFHRECDLCRHHIPTGGPLREEIRGSAADRFISLMSNGDFAFRTRLRRFPPLDSDPEERELQQPVKVSKPEPPYYTVNLEFSAEDPILKQSRGVAALFLGMRVSQILRDSPGVHLTVVEDVPNPEPGEFSLELRLSAEAPISDLVTAIDNLSVLTQYSREIPGSETRSETSWDFRLKSKNHLLEFLQLGLKLGFRRSVTKVTATLFVDTRKA